MIKHLARHLRSHLNSSTNRIAIANKASMVITLVSVLVTVPIMESISKLQSNRVGSCSRNYRDGNIYNNPSQSDFF